MLTFDYIIVFSENDDNSHIFFFRPYTHVDTPGDIDLETFQLQDEDVIDKVSQQNYVNWFIMHSLWYTKWHFF